MNKKFIWVFIAILIIIVGGVFYFLYGQQHPKHPPTITSLPANMSCTAMYDEIENDINNANYCQADSDCDVLILGARYIDFGCYHFVNKAVDKNQFYKNMDIYDQKCGQSIDDCAPEPKARCVSNKCVSP